MSSAAGAYLFLLGLACGLALLTATSYRRVSPPWLRWLLMLSGVFVMSLYAVLAVSATTHTQELLILANCWFASYLGLTLPSVFAVDQLLRHPAMTPKKLLAWYSPFLVVYVLALLAGNFNPLLAWGFRQGLSLAAGCLVFLLLLEGVFVIGFVSASAYFMRKVHSRPIRLALLGLIVGQSYLGVNCLLFAFTPAWYAQRFLYSHIVMLLALWHAYETSARLQQST